jgi:hypothetical protein
MKEHEFAVAGASTTRASAEKQVRALRPDNWRPRQPIAQVVPDRCGSIGRGFTSNWGMKRIAAIGAVVVALAWLCGLAAAQVGSHGSSLSASASPWFGNAQSNIIIIPCPPGTSPHPLLATASNRAFRIQPLPPGHRSPPLAVLPTGVTNLYWNLRSNQIVRPSAPSAIPPVVYRTFPYGCIVVVPGPHPDDLCNVNPGGGKDPMPVIKPELQLIPWDPAK